MTVRSRKRKATVEPNPTNLETSLTDNNQTEELIPGPSKNPRTYSENLDDIKSSLRKEIMSDLTKLLAENQKEMLKLITPVVRNLINPQNPENTDSEPVFPTKTSTPIRSKTTTQKTNPVNSRNKLLLLFIVLRENSQTKF